MPPRLLVALTVGLAIAASAHAGPGRPLVAILAEPAGTVATDLMTPYAILAESGAVDVKVVSPTHEPIRLTPGQAWVQPQLTLAELARQHPEGPNVVIVPAMEQEDNATRAVWLNRQIEHGTQVMAICNGARVLAAAGLLDQRQATVHWYSMDDMIDRYPKTAWRHDARWVSDGPVTTTAGISAGQPATLELLRRLAGDEVMRATAKRLGLAEPDSRHDGQNYRLTWQGAGLVVANRIAFWRHERVALPLEPGIDELAFGTALDAWSRTYRSTAWATGPAAVTSRHGLVIQPGPNQPADFDRQVPVNPADSMVATFERIGAAYGERTARFVALQFEHPYGVVAGR